MYIVIKEKNLMTEKSWQVDPIMNVIILWNPHWFRPLFSFFFFFLLFSFFSRHHRVATLSIIHPDWMVFHYESGEVYSFFFSPFDLSVFFLFINRDDSKIHIHTSSLCDSAMIDPFFPKCFLLTSRSIFFSSFCPDFYWRLRKKTRETQKAIIIILEKGVMT